MLLRAEADLARGDAAAALEGFERVAATGHAVEIELGLVRAYMQTGQYRRALGFAAHVAGEHPDVSAATVLYAWLLRAGGQVDVSSRVLAAALERSPDDAVARAAAAAFASAVPAAIDALLVAPHRMAPVAVLAPGQPAVSPQAQVVASGVLVDGGRRALVPASSLTARATRLWVRNGLGQTSEAEVEAPGSSATTGEALVLRLRLPIVVVDVAVADREPFAGSPGFAFEYPAAASPMPAWPQLRQGFLGTTQAEGGRRRLGFDVLHPGGPVLDAQGQLAGMVLADSEGQALMLPVSRWPRLAGSDLAATSGAPAASSTPAATQRPARPIAADAAYERAMAIALQVIALP